MWRYIGDCLYICLYASNGHVHITELSRKHGYSSITGFFFFLTFLSFRQNELLSNDARAFGVSSEIKSLIVSLPRAERELTWS